MSSTSRRIWTVRLIVLQQKNSCSNDKAQNEEKLCLLKNQCVIVEFSLTMDYEDNPLADRRRHTIWGDAQISSHVQPVDARYFQLRTFDTCHCDNKSRRVTFMPLIESMPHTFIHFPFGLCEFRNFVLDLSRKALELAIIECRWRIPSCQLERMMVPPASRRHVTVGSGLPVAAQRKVTLLPSLTIISVLVG